MEAVTKPTVEVVIPTRNRPELVRVAIDSVRKQTYDGSLSITVVFDGTPIDETLVSDGVVPVRVIPNDRAAGLAGARNSGITASSAELVAFLDDDDQWRPEKLARQVQRLVEEPTAAFATTAIEVNFDGTRTARLAGTSLVEHGQLLASRMAMLHSSTFLIRRTALLGDLGLVDEQAPAGQNEDWDLLLRASALHPIAHLDEPLVTVLWGSTSLFATAWDSKIAGLEWVLAQHPDIRSSRVGYARVLASWRLPMRRWVIAP